MSEFTKKKRVTDMSGWCRHSMIHYLCWGTWETPSAVVTCGCDCHRIMQEAPTIARPTIRPKGDLGHTDVRRIVAKS